MSVQMSELMQITLKYALVWETAVQRVITEEKRRHKVIMFRSESNIYSFHVL